MKKKSLLRISFATLLTLTGFLQVNAQSASRPNIVVITTDQQSADAMSFVMGKRWINTPNMDKLASQGVVFKRAYVANPICGPSRNSIITGLYPHTTRIEGNKELAVAGNPNQRNNQWTNADFMSMGTYFKNAGYETAYFGKWHLNYNPQNADAHGFETTEFTTENGKDSQLPGAVNNFLTRQHKNPFLLFVSILNPHNVCEYARFQTLPDGPIGNEPQPANLPPIKFNRLPPKNEAEAMTLMRESYHNNLKLFPVGHYTANEWRRLAWGYYRLIEKTDSIVGQILASIRKNGFDNNTLIVFTSDHGESLGAHEFNQKTVFYEESSRVPLILRYMGKLKPGTNNSLINTGIDILPTLLDFAGIPKPESLPGKSLKRSAEMKETLQREYIVIQNKMEQGGPVGNNLPTVTGRMVRSERYKYCLYDTLKNREELFDLKNDPGETINLANKKSVRDILVRQRGYLKEFATNHNDLYALQMLKHVLIN
ncbi:MAG: sulfatase-like hydrolase/transferase [Chitinophagaceae bacterium]